MLANSYKKDKSIYTMKIYNHQIEELERIRRLNDNKYDDDKIEDEKAYIKQVIKIVQDECNKELVRLTAKVDSQYQEKIDDLNEMWQASNVNLINAVDKETDINILERASNDMCEIMCSIYNKDFRTYNMIPIWDTTHQPTGLNSLIQNYELIIDDYLNTIGSKGLTKFDKTKKGYENRQDIDNEFEKAVLEGDTAKARECLEKGAYVDLQLDNSTVCALNYSLITNNEEMMALLLENGANANIRGIVKSSTGRMFAIIPILYAIEEGRYEYISQMITNGAKINRSMFDRILERGDDILIERILNETSIDCGVNKRGGFKGESARGLKNYMRRSENIDVMVKMYNNGLFKLVDMENLFYETNNVAILEVMDKLGYKFDYSNDYAKFMLRVIVERDIPDAMDFFLSKFENIHFGSMDGDDNLAVTKENIERNADVITLQKMAMADPKLNIENFKMTIPKERFLDIEYIKAAQELERLNANISYQPLGVGKGFDVLVEKMMKNDRTYKEQSISEQELISFDASNNNIYHYIAAFGDLEDLERVENEVNVNKDARNNRGYTPLALAILAKNYAVCGRLLHRNAVQLDRIFERENTYLHYAVQDGNLDLVKELIEGRAKQVPNIEGETPIYLSIRLNKTDIAKELINQTHEYGENALMYAAHYGNIDVAKLLISKGVDVNKQDEVGNTPLFAAVKNQDISMIKLLIKNNANIDAKNKFFETPIIYAIKNNLQESVEELIGLGANLALAEESTAAGVDKDKYVKGIHMGSGKTVLYYTKDKKMMRLLMINGANPYQKDAQGRYAFDVLKLASQYRKLEQKINETTFNKDEVNKIIKEMGEDINLPNPYRVNFTAVSYAAYKGNLDILTSLVENGGDVNVYDSGHTDALMVAVIAKKEACAMYLIENGANLEHTDRIGNNALMIAISNGLDNVAKAIIEKGINLEKSMPYGNPLLVAIECKKVDIIKQLIDKNVDITAKNTMGVPAYKLIENLQREYKIGDREYKMLDDILKSKSIEKGKGLGLEKGI